MGQTAVPGREASPQPTTSREQTTAPRYRAWFRRWWPCLLLLLASAALRLPLTSLEFGRNSDGTGALYAIAAHNYLTRGLGDALAMPVISVGSPDLAPTIYAHHPPTVPLTLAASWALLGDSDFAARLPWTLMTLAGVAVTYALVLRGTGRAAATAAAAVFALLPFSLRFGQMPDVINSMLVLAVLLAIWAYLRLLESPTAAREAAAGTALVAALLVDWPAFFAALVIWLHLLLTRPPRWRRWAVGLSVLTTLTFSLLVVWASLAQRDWGLIPRQFLNRVTRPYLDNHRPFGWADWFAGVWEYLGSQFTAPILVLAAVGALLALRGVSQLRTLTVLLAGWALVHVAVGRQGVLNHDWWWWPLLPGVCVGMGALVSRLPGRSPRGWAVVVLLAGLAFLAWGEMRRLLSPFWIHNQVPQFSVRELGLAIRAAPGDAGAAVLSFTDEAEPYLFHYARRPVVERIWTVADLHQAMQQTEAELFYGFRQRLRPPPAAFVFPQAWAEHGNDLLGYLRAHHPYRQDGAFLVFDLRQRR